MADRALYGGLSAPLARPRDLALAVVGTNDPITTRHRRGESRQEQVRSHR